MKAIRGSPNASRITIKHQSGLSMDPTLALVNELLEEGLILSLGKSEDSDMGCKPALQSLPSKNNLAYKEKSGSNEPDLSFAYL